MGSICICDTYVCLCTFSCMYIFVYWYLVCKKAFSDFSMDCSLSIQLEDVDFIKSEGGY